MSTDLQNLTKSELITRLTAKELQVEKLQQSLANKDRLIAQFQRMIFGQTRERFTGDPDQGSLPFAADPIVEKAREAEHEQATKLVRKNASRPNHNGRHPLPDHLPVEEVHIHPDGDLSGMECIGQEVTDELELQPARLYINRYIRHKYAPVGGGAPCIGALPDRVIDKCIAGPGLLVTILVDKYTDHLPLYRQRQWFAREEELSPDERKELRLARSLPIINTLGAWIHAEIKNVLPKSQIGKAMAYSAKRWDALSEYMHDGVLEIDNNLVENTIRPLALGRKNYLFTPTGSLRGRIA